MDSKPVPSVGFAELRSFLEKRRRSLDKKAADKRREPRYETNDVVEVEIMQTGFQRVKASIMDVSRSGLSLQSQSAIGKGSHVKITLPTHAVVFGEVQYCRPVRRGFQCGIVIQDVFSPRGKR